MTSLVAWIASDSRFPTSIYIATDSKISWNESKQWDMARKTFYSSKLPLIAGYVGDVLFPTQVIGQIFDLLDSQNIDIREIIEVKNYIVSSLKNSISTYPERNEIYFSVVIGIRIRDGIDCEFELHRLQYSKGSWTESKESMKSRGEFLAMGSGSENVKSTLMNWYKNNIGNSSLSRVIYSAFVESISSGNDGFSGGAPQLVGVYSKDHAKGFGVFHLGKRFYLGAPILRSSLINPESIPWRNELFEVVDGDQGTLKVKAKRHNGKVE